MIINFRARRISRGARKLTRTPTLKKDNGTQMYNTKLSSELISRLNCSLADSMGCLGVWLRLFNFRSVFHLEMHQNNIFFYFLKIIFDISALK